MVGSERQRANRNANGRSGFIAVIVATIFVFPGSNASERSI